ncbi:MAG: TonB family protein [Acidobacteria bacterium]|jgi:TonB family protein|nr:TonB family protein [Acidobacteriota bacterium]
MRANSTSANTSPAAGTVAAYLENDREHGRLLQAALAVAVMLHVVAFAVNWPALSGPGTAAQENAHAVLLVVRNVMFEKPPLTTELPKPPRRVVQIPDQEPHGPEVLRQPESPATEVPKLGDVVLGEVKIPPPPPPEHRVVEAYTDIAPPKVTHRVQPIYTRVAIAVGFQGKAIVELLIDEQGNVAKADLVDDPGLGLGDSALNAVRQWRFEPSTLNGRPVSVIYRVTVWFHLQGQNR